MAELKTRPTEASVADFIASVENETRRADASTVLALMQRVTGEAPRMWGPSIVGFGSYRYTNTQGKDFEWFLTGFSPRKANLVCYIMPGYGQFDDVMERIGKHKTGKACLYINKLADIEMAVLEELVTKSVELMRERYDV